MPRNKHFNVIICLVWGESYVKKGETATINNQNLLCLTTKEVLMFLIKLVRLTLIAIVFIAAYLPITINPEVIAHVIKARRYAMSRL